MSSNNTFNSEGNQPGIGLDLTNPATVLPLVAVLIVALLILVGGCIIYHKRQNKRTQDLVRQLKVTERRMDSMGKTQTSKKDQCVNKKTDYCPPATATCSRSSVSSNNADLALSGQQKPNPCTDGCKEDQKTFTVTVQLNDNDLDSLEATLDTSTNDTSYYCSTCKIEESESAFAYCTEGTDTFDSSSSLAAECATIPALSSLSTECSTTTIKQPPKECHKGKRSKPDLHKKTLKNQFSKRSVRFIRGFRLASGNSTRSPDPKQISLPEELCIAIEAQKTNRSYCQANPASTTKQKSSLAKRESLTKKESRDQPDSSNKTPPQPIADSCTTKVKGKNEKWV